MPLSNASQLDFRGSFRHTIASISRPGPARTGARPEPRGHLRLEITPDPTARHFLPDAVKDLKRLVAEHGGNEVFFVGRPAEITGKIGAVEAVARGNGHSVPAILDIAREGEVVIHNHPSGVLIPSEADLSLASHYGNCGVGFLIIDNTAEQVLVVVKPFTRRPKERLHFDQIQSRLGPTGQLANTLPGYEARPGQLEMARTVLESFNSDGLAVVEAGTGTGKSLAYLLPAALYAIANKEAVVVATHTINLQEQLFSKDAPQLMALEGLKDLRVALLKGRGNYLCNRKFEYYSGSPEELLGEEMGDAVRGLALWYQRTELGTRSELTAPLPEDLWDRLAADEDDCTRVKCEKYEQCFYFKARREAAGAHILIVNQHLLMADLAVRHAVGDYKRALVLPPYRRIVLDEAHHLEEVATSFISGKVNNRALLRLAGRLVASKPSRRGNAEERRGLLPILAGRLAKAGIEQATVDPLYQLMNRRIEPAVESLRRMTRDYLQEIAAQLRLELIELGTPNENAFRIRQAFTETPLWLEVIQSRLTELESCILQLTSQLNTLCERLDTLPERFKQTEQQLLLELAAMKTRLLSHQKRLREFLAGGENLVRWIEIEQSRQFEPSAALCTSPIEVAEILSEMVFEPLKTTVMTSATLTAAGKFDYFQERVGLEHVDASRIKRLSVVSPFDYARQVYFAIPTDLPDPRDRSHQDRLIDVVEEAVLASGGGAFVLFTSYQLLNAVCEAIKARGRVPYPILKHGEEPRHRLLDRFKSFNHSILFGTDSFWEGVDVQGEALRMVIITRLPFQVPSEPVQEARAERIKERGMDPFQHISLPQAIIKFKQGFGRLIRHKGDRGVVMVLDQRIAGKAYGRHFLEAVHGVQPFFGPSARLLQDMRDFFAGRPVAARSWQEDAPDWDPDSHRPREIPGRFERMAAERRTLSQGTTDPDGTWKAFERAKEGNPFRRR